MAPGGSVRGAFGRNIDYALLPPATLSYQAIKILLLASSPTDHGSPFFILRKSKVASSAKLR